MLRDRLLEQLRARVQLEVDLAAQPGLAARAEVPELGQRLAETRDRLGRMEAALEDRTAPFSMAMTVHQAWGRHPGVRQVFAARGLPDCDLCAVGGDETLEEACQGYALSPQALLEELNALLRG